MGGETASVNRLSLGKTKTFQFMASIFSIEWAARSSDGKVQGWLGEPKWEELRKWRCETVCTESEKASELKSVVGCWAELKASLSLVVMNLQRDQPTLL